MYRFEQHVGAILKGGPPQPCRIRKGDEFQEFCGLLNQLIARLPEAGDPTQDATQPDAQLDLDAPEAVLPASSDAHVPT
jgi:hypothetical protein